MALERELQETMEQQATWQGNPDRLWAKVADEISRPVWAPSRRWSWRIPAWGAAAVVALALGVLGLRHGTLPGLGTGGIPNSPGRPAAPGIEAPQAPPSTAPGVPDHGKAEGERGSWEPQKEQPPNIRKEAKPDPVRRPAPAPAGLRFEIIPSHEAYAPGEPARLTVRLWNASENRIDLDATVPRLLITPLAEPYDLSRPALATLPLSALAGRSLEPGESVGAEAVWQLAQASPGWYRAVLDTMHYRVGADGTPATTGGGQATFLFAYPAGTVRTGTVEPGARSTLHGITLTVRRMEFTERETKVFFHISDLRAPADVGFTLVRPGGAVEGAYLGLSHRDSAGGGIEGEARFGPTATSDRSLTVEVPRLSVVHVGQGMEEVLGPWRVTIPLNGEVTVNVVATTSDPSGPVGTATGSGLCQPPGDYGTA